MKRNVFLVMFLTLIIMFFSACTGQNKEDKTRKGWTLVWDDDFNAETGLASWSKIERGKLPMNRYMSDKEGLYVFADGKLVLRGLGNSAEDTDLPFLTGGITRKEVIKQNQVCRIEVRAQLHPVAGAVPFVSFLPSDGTENISIHVMEQFDLDNYIYQSLTSEYTTTLKMFDNPPSSSLVRVNPTQYQIYGIEMYADSVIFFVDNQRTKKYPRILTDMPGQFPFADLDFDLFIGVRLNKETNPSDLPADMIIDWIRYYEPAIEENK